MALNNQFQQTTIDGGGSGGTGNITSGGSINNTVFNVSSNFYIRRCDLPSWHPKYSNSTENILVDSSIVALTDLFNDEKYSKYVMRFNSKVESNSINYFGLNSFIYSDCYISHLANFYTTDGTTKQVRFFVEGSCPRLNRQTCFDRLKLDFPSNHSSKKGLAYKSFGTNSKAFEYFEYSPSYTFLHIFTKNGRLNIYQTSGYTLQNVIAMSIFEDSDFPNNVQPKLIYIEIQAAGGGGGGEHYNALVNGGGAGGGGGAFGAFIIDVQKYHWIIRIGGKGKGDLGFKAGTNAYDCYITRETNLAVGSFRKSSTGIIYIGGGKGGKYNDKDSTGGGKGGECSICNIDGLTTIYYCNGGNGGGFGKSGDNINVNHTAISKVITDDSYKTNLIQNYLDSQNKNAFDYCAHDNSNNENVVSKQCEFAKRYSGKISMKGDSSDDGGSGGSSVLGSGGKSGSDYWNDRNGGNGNCGSGGGGAHQIGVPKDDHKGGDGGEAIIRLFY